MLILEIQEIQGCMDLKTRLTPRILFVLEPHSHSILLRILHMANCRWKNHYLLLLSGNYSFCNWWDCRLEQMRKQQVWKIPETLWQNVNTWDVHSVIITLQLNQIQQIFYLIYIFHSKSNKINLFRFVYRRLSEFWNNIHTPYYLYECEYLEIKCQNMK